MESLTLKQFNKCSVIPEGWFWLEQSKSLPKKSAKSVRFFGRDFALYRGEDGKVRCLDAFCPHMGAHLGDGLVEGNELRCLFHNWKFSEKGVCSRIPGRKHTKGIPGLNHYKIAEKHGLIWLWTGQGEPGEIPVPPELKGLESDFQLGKPFAKPCHPNVVMINAIDANHFNTVHNLFVDLDMQDTEISRENIEFSNQTAVPRNSWLTRFIGRFYANALTYSMSYWYGHTGSVTLGPDFLHFYIVFALRPTPEGGTEGQTILLTKKRRGIWGRVVNSVLLFLTKLVGNYFAKGDTVIFNNIKFDFKFPLREDRAIVKFVEHYERQKVSSEFSTLIPLERTSPRQECLQDL